MVQLFFLREELDGYDTSAITWLLISVLRKYLKEKMFADF